MQIKLNLSDTECQDVLEMCAKHDITIQMLLESFISDLTASERSAGSDERMYAEAWLNRRYGAYNSNSLLSHLIETGYLEEYAARLNDIQEIQEDAEYMTKHTNEANEELEQQLADMRDSWEHDDAYDLEAEHTRIMNYLHEKESFMSDCTVL